MDVSGSKKQRLIWLKVAAPAKPLLGQVCNGCGVCCAAEPCPVARIFLWQWRGACRALIWWKLISSIDAACCCNRLLTCAFFLAVGKPGLAAWWRAGLRLALHVIRMLKFN